MNDSLRLVVVLTAVCLISALLVAVANEITREPIQKAKERQNREAILAVQPEGASAPVSNDVQVAGVSPDGGATVYYATDKGYAFKMVAPNGYAGPIELMLGFTKDGRFWSYRVLSDSETPGLGSHIKDSFLDHVKERSVTGTNWKTTKDGGDIVPITAATISSRAVCDAIARGARVYDAIQQQEGR
ncbi:MAG: RnfABCDGE type electron transport complex subunit G [Kiritimatiellia bacterium]|jgi:electron transport complex protein RnfG